MRGMRLGATARCRAAVAAALLLASGADAQLFVFDFAPATPLPLGFDGYPNSIDAGHIDADPWVDLILSGRNNDGFSTIFPGTPTGFGAAIQLDMGGQTNWALIRDFNTSDCFNDLVLSHRSGLGRISVLPGNGTLVPEGPIVHPVGRTPQLIGSADLDGDLDLDLAVFNANSFDISILHNDGNGVFTVVQRIAVNRTASTSAAPTWARIADVNGDQHLDIVTANIQSHGVLSVLRNLGDGTFDRGVQHAVAGIKPGEAMGTLAAADVDGDDDIDLVTKTGDLSFDDRIIVLTNDGNGSFEAALTIQLQSAPWDITTGDFDSDGHEDLVWVTHAFSSQAAGFLRNQGTGVPDFGVPGLEMPLGGFPRHVAVYDIDGDTDLDVLVADIGNQGAMVLENLLVQPEGRKRTQGPFPLRKRTLGPFSPPASLADAMTQLAEWGEQPASVPAVREDARESSGVCGDPKAGDCFEEHEGPGCDDEECCTLVCGKFPLCCVMDWDQTCADIANDACEPPPVCPSEGSCFEVHGNAGCDDTVCCELVCGFDPYCCGLPWDQLCADEALQLCGLPECVIPECSPAATLEPETIDCSDRVNDGCNMEEAAFTPITCNEIVCGTSSTLARRDTDWYEITVDDPAHLVWSVRAEFPAELFIVSGTCEDEYVVIASAFSDPCGLATATVAVDPGTYYLFVAPGFAALGMDRGIGCTSKGEVLGEGPFGHRYTVSAGCGSGCAEDVSGDGIVGIADMLILLSAWGTDPGGPPDLDGDGNVGITDFTALLAAWGPC